MRKAYDTFKYLIEETNNAKVIFDYLETNKIHVLDYSDLLRWQWIQSVSCIDKLIHELILKGICDIYLKKRSLPKALTSFKTNFVNIIEFDKITEETDRLSFIRDLIIETNKHKSFQNPQTIADGLSYIWEEPNKWKKISTLMGFSEKNVKTQLTNISIRRNQIVHESDYQNIIFERQSINKSDTKKTVDFIKKLGEAIYKSVK